MENIVLSCLESRVENKRSFYGRFLLGPFSPGHGITVATALRRSLLSELDGVGISAVEISGVTHEFATIRGMRESVLDLSLNLRNVVLTANSYLSTPEIGYLQIQGPGIVKAGDLKLPHGIRCIDPNQHLAKLSTDGSLAFKFVLSRLLSPLNTDTFQSFGLSTSIYKFESQKRFQDVSFSKRDAFMELKISEQREENNRYDITKGYANEIKDFSEEDLQRKDLPNNSRMCNSLRHVLLLDPVFSPVNRVNFLLEPDDLARKSRDRVIFEVWTNGSITPRQAIHQASLSLIRLFSNLDQAKNLLSFKSGSSQRDLRLFPPRKPTLVSLDIGNLSLSVESYIGLKLAKINTVFDLASYTRDQLLDLKGLGEKELDNIENNLFYLGLSLVK